MEIPLVGTHPKLSRRSIRGRIILCITERCVWSPAWSSDWR